MPKPESFPIEKIFVPTKQKKAIKPETVGEIAESMLDIGQQEPISVRLDGDRLVLVEGLHRLEACKALGETTILALLVSADTAHPKLLRADSVGVEAVRDKMARLKRLRLEQQAAGNTTATAKVGEKPGSHSQNAIGTKLKTPSSRSARTAATRPRTLSEWLTHQKRDGGRY